MNAQDVRNAVDYALNSYEGEPVYIGDSTIVVGMDSDSGRYWVADNGDETTGLDYDGVMGFCLAALVDEDGERNVYADSQAETEAGTVYPQYIYATPDEWGNETYYMTEKAMHVNIANLRTLGDDWADISIDDCAEWTLVEVLRISDDETLAIYACHEGRHPTYCRLHSTGNGYFSERGAYRNIDDARSDE